MRLKRLFIKLIPPEEWLVPVIIAAAIFTGLFLYAFYISNAPSYLSDNPKTCVNCHIMSPQYATWSHSSHKTVTNCNDCHVPHNNVFNKYFFKAKDGMRHASIFTLRAEPQVIFIKEAGRGVVHKNCIRCHIQLLYDARIAKYSKNVNHFRQERKCWECHRETPHGRVNSLSSTPNARVPLPESPVPAWMKAKNEKK